MMLGTLLLQIVSIGLTTRIRPLLAVVEVDTVLRWEMSPWSDCVLKKTCAQPGLKIRTVGCFQNQTQIQAEKCETKLDLKPPSIETCVPESCVNERRDRVRIIRTEWSKCTIQVNGNLNEYTINKRKLSCNDTSKIVVPYVKERKIQCHFTYNKSLLKKIESSFCLKLLNSTSLVEKQLCSHKCVKPCALNSWSKWIGCKQCRNENTKYTLRTYASLPTENMPEVCPQQVQVESESNTRHGRQYQHKLTSWKHVSILFQKKKARSRFSIYKRNVTCVDRRGMTCNVTNKNIATIKIQVGDRNCLHDEWSTWSACTAAAITNEKRRQNLPPKYKQYRDRDILLYPSGNGNRCGERRQQRKCNNTLHEALKHNDGSESHAWDNGNWSPCFINDKYDVPIDNRNCRAFVSKRDVFCIQKSGNQPVNDVFCSRLSKSTPTNNRLCRVECPHDCLYSEWSNWTQCVNNVMERSKDNLNILHLNVCPMMRQRKSCSPQQITNTTSISMETDDAYFWHQTSWNDCEITPHENNDTVHDCLIGTSVKKNICVRNNIHEIVDDSFCKDYLRSAPQFKKCFVCPKKCALTTWSQWYPDCSATCNPFDNNQPVFTHRKRYILNHGNAQGDECHTKKLLEIVQCPKCLDYHWQADKWELCTHSNIQVEYSARLKGLKNGYQLRNVYCTDGEKVVPDSWCHQLKPLEFRDCHINWLVTCNITPWSDWSECSEVCGGGHQQRVRSFTSQNCENDGNLHFNETRVCNTQPCHEYHVRKGPWSNCHVIGTISRCSGLNVNLGVKYRNITCYDKSNHVVPNKYCEEHDEKVFATKRRCVIPCGNDCRMSEWSAFTACSAQCGIGVSMRQRKIFMHASPGLAQCPPNNGRFVTQSVPCKVVDCFDFKWQKEAWGQCITESVKTKCGKGKQYRNVTCLQLSNKTPSHMCDSKQKPKTQRQCYTACQTECLLSDWSEWTSCDDSRSSMMNRTRHIIRNGINCPLQFQRRACRKEIMTSWKPSAWSSCFTGGNSNNGIRTRFVDCIDNRTQESIHPKHCIQYERPTTHEICQQTTNNECQTSEWTRWSSCERRCSQTTYKTRTRIANKHCNDGLMLKETLKCPKLPCFKLSLGKWSDCKPTIENTCGEGQRERNATCIRDDNNIVDLLHCDDHLTGKSSTKEACNIPCWDDCVVSSWSNWTSCFGECDKENNAGKLGRQIRSRFVLQEAVNGGRRCPDNMEETRPCYTPKCFTFAWVANNGKYICQRSDGVEVSSGCVILPSMVKCGCNIKHATRIQNEYCVCEQRMIECFGPGPAPERHQNSEESFSVSNIICISVAVVIGYCLLFAAIMFIYKRRKKKNHTRHNPESKVLHLPIANRNHHGNDRPHSRNLIRLSNRNSNSCSSGISSAGMTDQTTLCSLQTGVDVMVTDSDHYDEYDGILTAL